MSNFIEKKLEMKPCKAKKHVFVPSIWRISAAKHIANEFVCQHCLMTVDRTDVEVVRQCFDESFDTTAE